MELWQEREAQTQQDELIRCIVGVTAAHVDGVTDMGDGFMLEEGCFAPCEEDQGRGVRVHRWGQDVWVYIHCIAEAGVNPVWLKSEVAARVQMALDNILARRAVRVEVTLEQTRQMPVHRSMPMPEAENGMYAPPA